MLSDEEYQKDNKTSARHVVEEAMTNAFLRKCNGCGRAFLKEDGCNKMTCPFCLHRQCYVCSKTIIDYQHFDNPLDENPCPMYGDMSEFLSAQVDSAQDTKVRELLDTRSDLKEEDIRVDTPKRRKTKTVQPQIDDDDDLLFQFYIPPPRLRNAPRRQREPPPAPRPFQPGPPPLGAPPAGPHFFPHPPIEPPQMFPHPQWEPNPPPQPAALPPRPQPQWQLNPPPAMRTPPMTWGSIPPPMPDPGNPVFPWEFPRGITHPTNPVFPTTWPNPPLQIPQHGPVPWAPQPWLGPEIQMYPNQQYPPNPGPFVNHPGPAQPRGWW